MSAQLNKSIIDEKERQFTMLFNEISSQVSSCIQRGPWSPSKVIELYPRAVALAEDLIREYEKTGDMAKISNKRFLLDMLKTYYEYALKGRC